MMVPGHASSAALSLIPRRAMLQVSCLWSSYFNVKRCRDFLTEVGQNWLRISVYRHRVCRLHMVSK